MWNPTTMRMTFLIVFTILLSVSGPIIGTEIPAKTVNGPNLLRIMARAFVVRTVLPEHADLLKYRQTLNHRMMVSGLMSLPSGTVLDLLGVGAAALSNAEAVNQLSDRGDRHGCDGNGVDGLLVPELLNLVNGHGKPFRWSGLSL